MNPLMGAIPIRKANTMGKGKVRLNQLSGIGVSSSKLIVRDY
jgi:hypothetical protein